LELRLKVVQEGILILVVALVVAVPKCGVATEPLKHFERLHASACHKRTARADAHLLLDTLHQLTFLGIVAAIKQLLKRRHADAWHVVSVHDAAVWHVHGPAAAHSCRKEATKALLQVLLTFGCHHLLEVGVTLEHLLKKAALSEHVGHHAIEVEIGHLD